MSKMLCSREVCTGCGACSQSCSFDAIVMEKDGEGFFSPVFHEDRCTRCRRCEGVCPILNPPDVPRTESPEALLCWNLDKAARKRSASGGMFSVFAEHTLGSGGAVFGAAYVNGFQLHQRGITDQSQLPLLCSSKYFQSETEKTFREVADYLKRERQVLYTGTPCQIAGLYGFLGPAASHPGLLTCDLICHGVPAQIVFQKYLDELQKKYDQAIISYNFRSKKLDWREYSSHIQLANHKEVIIESVDNPYMRGFKKRLFYRNSCYVCPFAKLPRIGDITLGDYFRVAHQKEYLNEAPLGLSLMTINSDQGYVFCQFCKKDFASSPVSLSDACESNRNLNTPSRRPLERDGFYRDFPLMSFRELTNKYMKKPLTLRVILRTLIGRRFYRFLKSTLSKIR